MSALRRIGLTSSSRYDHSVHTHTSQTGPGQYQPTPGLSLLPAGKQPGDNPPHSLRDPRLDIRNLVRNGGGRSFPPHNTWLTPGDSFFFFFSPSRQRTTDGRGNWLVGMRDLLVLWYNNKKHARSGDGCGLMMAFEVENTADKFSCGGGASMREMERAGRSGAMKISIGVPKRWIW